jgi:hypothetical protein
MELIVNQILVNATIDEIKTLLAMQLAAKTYVMLHIDLVNSTFSEGLPEVFKAMRNTIVIFPVTTVLNKISLIITIAGKLYHNIPEVGYTIVKTFIKYFR